MLKSAPSLESPQYESDGSTFAASDDSNAIATLVVDLHVDLDE